VLEQQAQRFREFRQARGTIPQRASPKSPSTLERGRSAAPSLVKNQLVMQAGERHRAHWVGFDEPKASFDRDILAGPALSAEGVAKQPHNLTNHQHKIYNKTTSPPYPNQKTAAQMPVPYPSRAHKAIS